MVLHKLRVLKNKKILREVQFKVGLNLIVNSATGSEKTGNSVGKSTPSRLLDYLFLSDGSDIYTEPEFGKMIPEVVDFIEDNEIEIDLTFSSYDNQIHHITRNLTTSSKNFVYSINTESVDKKNYEKFISFHIFGNTSEKPSVRVLSHKFIRNTNEKMQNTTKFLHITSKPDVYDQLYLYLFGFSGLELLKSKATLNNEISKKTKHLAAYRTPHRESALQKMISPLRSEEENLEERIRNFDFRGSQETSVQELVKIQREMSEFTIQYSAVRSRIDYLERSILNLKNKTTQIDGRDISVIYQEAGIAISSKLKRSYEELVVFHNAVVSNKLNLIAKDLEKSIEIASQLQGGFKLEVQPCVIAIVSEP